MISTYIAHVLRSLDRAQVMPSEQIQRVSGLDQAAYCKLLTDADGGVLQIENVDRIVDFFGMGIFNSNFVKESFICNNSQYKSWEGLDRDEQKLINIAGVYAASTKSPIGLLNYTKECSYFLETCDNLISIVQESGSSDDGTDGETEITK